MPLKIFVAKPVYPDDIIPGMRLYEVKGNKTGQGFKHFYFDVDLKRGRIYSCPRFKDVPDGQDSAIAESRIFKIEQVQVCPLVQWIRKHMKQRSVPASVLADEIEHVLRKEVTWKNIDLIQKDFLTHFVEPSFELTRSSHQRDA